ncbi:putative pentatricopeptide repeat-containing protein [Senna tora]|uniref:Putative pentatricopeptide repeat-containing protein n=1 Tax=Senna tora TaxID=362788 RepID=A0A834TL30_9FABA|nr:putative pentatricopeptide repeat-containing protein [Senna tora]
MPSESEIMGSCANTHLRLYSSTKLISLMLGITKLFLFSTTSNLIDLYGKCISLSAAPQLFDEVPNRNVMWNTMISLYTHSHNIASALQLFDVMDIMPSESIVNSIIIAGLADGTNLPWCELSGFCNPSRGLSRTLTSDERLAYSLVEILLKERFIGLAGFLKCLSWGTL